MGQGLKEIRPGPAGPKSFDTNDLRQLKIIQE